MSRSDVPQPASRSSVDAASQRPAAVLRQAAVGEGGRIGLSSVEQQAIRMTLAILWPSIFLAGLVFLVWGTLVVQRYRHIRRHPPSAADFALYGQLRTLSADPTPAALLRAQAPRLEYWLRRADDLSGVDGQWQVSPQPGAVVVDLLHMIGDTHLPYLAANARADAAGRDHFAVDLAGGPFAQPPFRFHVKCLAALRAAYAALTPAEKDRAAPVLMTTGCLAYLQP